MLKGLLAKVPDLPKDPTKTEETQVGVMREVAEAHLIGEIGEVMEDTGETEVVMKDIKVETHLEGSPEGDPPEEGVTAKETMTTRTRVFSEG